MLLFGILIISLQTCILFGSIECDDNKFDDWFSFRLDSLAGLIRPAETPIVIHFAHMYTLARYQCISHFADLSLDGLTLSKPNQIITPSSMHNTCNRQLCLRYLPSIFGTTFSSIELRNKTQAHFLNVFNKYNLSNPVPSFSIDDNVINCDQNKDCLKNIAAEYNYSPYIMASIIADSIIYEFSNDGWNMFGLLKYNNNNGKIEECTANCKPYSDYTGYKPQNNPYSDISGYGTDKYDKYWQPLQETDSYGFFYRDEHVTPHIGIHGKRYLLNKYVSAVDPEYDYKKEGMDLILRLKELATSDYQKSAVEIFDNKLNVRAIILSGLHSQYPDEIGNSFETTRLFQTGISFAEYEAVLQAWNEKIIYDLVRPTTVIQKWGNIDIETYGGPYQGVKIIKAKDFEPYIRVMPHSEYPSGSACICKAYQEYTDKFVQYYFGDESIFNLSATQPAYSSKVEPGITPKNDINIIMEDMNELLYICSESRLWGGMHFRKSVDEAIRICSGIGTKAFELIQKIQNNDTIYNLL